MMMMMNIDQERARYLILTWVLFVLFVLFFFWFFFFIFKIVVEDLRCNMLGYGPKGLRSE